MADTQSKQTQSQQPPKGRKKEGPAQGSGRRKRNLDRRRRFGKPKSPNTALDRRRGAKSIHKRNELQLRLVDAIEKYSELDRHGQPTVRSLSPFEIAIPCLKA